MGISTQIAPKTVATMKGPGPNLALRYRKKKHPVKMKTQRITVGPASRYRPVRTTGREGFLMISLRALLARKIPRQFHLMIGHQSEHAISR